MNKTLTLRYAVLTVLLFVVGLTGCSRTPESSKTEEGTIVIRFRGLMVFDKTSVNKKISVRMGVDPMDHHRLSIQLKGPDYGGFIEWADEYSEDEHFDLEVSGATIREPSWVSYPFEIAKLHQATKLVIDQDVFM